MSKTYYEAHITFLEAEKPNENVKELIQGYSWKYSMISGDANLGDGIKHYATRQFPSHYTEEKMLEELDLVSGYLEKRDHKILRKKIEKVIHDSKSSLVKVKCTGACKECVSEGPFSSQTLDAVSELLVDFVGMEPKDIWIGLYAVKILKKVDEMGLR